VIQFNFIARCGDENLPLAVAVDYRPGKQAQRARRVAVGELLAVLGCETATVDASGDEQVSVTTPEGTWVIAQARGQNAQRGRF
jgi:hypothetical protein